MIIVDGHSGCQTVSRIVESSAVSEITADMLMTYIKQNVVGSPQPKKLECIVLLGGRAQTLSPRTTVPADAVVFLYFTKQESDLFVQRFPTAVGTRQQNLVLSLTCLNAPTNEYFSKVGQELSLTKDLCSVTMSKVDAARDDLPQLRRTLEEMPLADPTAECRTLADRIPIAQISETIQKARSMCTQVGADVQQIFVEFDAAQRHSVNDNADDSKGGVSGSSLENLMQDAEEKLRRLSVGISDIVKLQKRAQKAAQVLQAIKKSLVPYETAAKLPVSYPRAVEAATRRTILRRATSRLLNLLREEQDSVQQLNSQFLKEFGQSFPSNLIPGLGRNLPPLIAEEDEVAKYMDPHVQDVDEDQTHLLLERLVPSTLNAIISGLQREKERLAEQIREASANREQSYQQELSAARERLSEAQETSIIHDTQIVQLQRENAVLKDSLQTERQLSQERAAHIAQLELENSEMQIAIENVRQRWCAEAANSSRSSQKSDAHLATSSPSISRSNREATSSWKVSVEELESSAQFKTELLDKVQKELESKEAIVQILHEQQKSTSFAASSSAIEEQSAEREAIAFEAAALVGSSRWFIRRGSRYENMFVRGVVMEVVPECTRGIATEDCVELRITKVVDVCGKTVHVEAVPC